MQIKRAFTKEQSRKKIIDEKYRKVFIVGLNPSTKRKDIKEYFSKFGKIEEVRIIFDKMAKTSRGRLLELTRAT